MARSNFALTALLIGVAACACAGGGGGKGRQSDPERARQLLLKTLDRSYPNNVIALITQRSPENHGNIQRIQVQISRDGKMRQTVIYPLSMQGIETIDDGKSVATFFPDEKMVVVQASAKLLPNDATTRINLTIRNYGLQLGGTTSVAGHRATIVVATPRSKQMETRRYYIDERTGFLLQLETIDGEGTVRTAFKAQQVTYPSSISAKTFGIDLEERADRKIVYSRPKGLFEGSTNKAIPKLNFEPVLPESMPFGFDMTDAQINENSDFGSIAIRITDGPIKGTVYQYSSSDAKNMKAMLGTTLGEAGGIKFVVAVDVPESVRKKILATFMEAARKNFSSGALGLSPVEELLTDASTLTPDEATAIMLLQSVSFFALPLNM